MPDERTSGDIEEKINNTPNPVLERIFGKVGEWVGRYWVAELTCTGTLILAAYGIPTIIDFVNQYFGIPEDILQPIKQVSMAFGATHAENAGFYGVMAYKHLQETRGDTTDRITINDLTKTAWNMFKEFGPAEFIDSFLIRPAALGVGKEVGGFAGLMAGKLFANATFFTPTIISYELEQRRKRKSTAKTS